MDGSVTLKIEKKDSPQINSAVNLRGPLIAGHISPL